jgi:hypothetical protein
MGTSNEEIIGPEAQVSDGFGTRPVGPAVTRRDA